MDKLKAATGWKHLDEGREPVSGAQGEGTTAEPYDSGNKQEATETADSTQDASEFDSEHAYLGSAIEADQARAADASKSEQTPSSTNTAEEPPVKEEKKGGGGFLSSIGFGGGSKEKKEEKEAQAGAEKETQKEEPEKPLRPNHLGSAVPEGASKDLADAGTVAPDQTDGLAAQKPTTTSTEPPTVSEPAPAPATTVDTTPRSPVTPTSAGKQPDRGGSMSSSGLSPDRSRSTGGSAAPVALPGSRGEGRGSMVPADAPRYKRVENPDRIPIAGGKRIGEEQYQTRRASMAPGSGSPPPPPPSEMQRLDREGSPDPVTAVNTEKNIQPTSPAPAPTTTAPAAAAAPVEAKNTAPQQMKDFSMGDASRDPATTTTTATASPGAGATDEVAPEDGPNGPVPTSTAGRKPPSSPPPTSGGKENSSGSGGGRRGSMFGKLKEKMKGGGKSGS